MSQSTLSPLMVTPEPNKRENILGYLLRASDMNGYEGINQILRYAGRKAGSMHVLSQHFEIIESVFGPVGRDLINLEHVHILKRHNLKLRDALSSKTNPLHINLREPKICPSCIVENGYIDLYWDIKYVECCPKHRIKLIDTCPSCGKSLSWFRRGILRCRCGFDLLKVEVEDVYDEDLIILNAFVRNMKYRNSLLHRVTLDKPYPITWLLKQSFDGFLWLISQLHLIYDLKFGSSEEGKRSVLKLASEVLSDWPNGFYNYLEVLDSHEKEKLNIDFGASGSGKRLYALFFNSIYSEREYKFLQKEFINFINQYGKAAYFDKRIYDRVDVDRNIIGITEMADYIGVRPSTLKSMVEKGMVTPCNNGAEQRSRYLFDVKEEHPRRIESGKSYSERQAALELGLPTSVLRILRKKGVYRTRYIGTKLESYHEYDIQSFKDKILREIKEISTDQIELDKYISIASVMQKKLCGPEGKVDFICAVIEGDIQPIGVIDGEISKIIFQKEDVDKLMRKINESRLSSILVVEAAQRLKCDPTAIPDLIAKGYLTVDPNSFYTRIWQSSLDKFASKYVSCAWVAETKATSANSIIRRCKHRGMKLLQVKRSHSEANQAFMLRNDTLHFKTKPLSLFYTDS